MVFAFGLTGSEASAVQEIWSATKGNELMVGCKVFKKMFTYHPEYESFFTRFKNPGQEIYDNPEFQKHMTANVIGALTKLVDSLEKPDEAQKAAFSIGEKHKKRNNTKQHFDSMIPIILEVLTEVKGDLGPNAAIWKKFLGEVMATMAKGLQ